MSPLRVDIFENVFFLVNAEISNSCSTRNRMAAIGEATPQHVSFEIVRDLARYDNCAQRHVAAGETLGASDQVGFDAVMLGGKPTAGAAKAAHHLIVDDQDAVLI